MAVVSMFFGIVISMYNEIQGRHHLAHIHVRYSEYEASVSFDGCVLAGGLPSKKLTLVQAWIVVHREELEANWALMEEGQEIFRIDPLR